MNSKQLTLSSEQGSLRKAIPDQAKPLFTGQGSRWTGVSMSTPCHPRTGSSFLKSNNEQKVLLLPEPHTGTETGTSAP